MATVTPTIENRTFDERGVELRNTVTLGDVVIDEDTGEILEGLDSRNVASIIHRRLFASDQMKAWEAEKAIWDRVLARLLDAQDVARLETPAGTARRKSFVRRSAPVTDAVMEELQADGVPSSVLDALLIAAAKELDVKTVESFVATHALQPRQAAQLIKETPVAYIEVSKPRLPAAPARRGTRPVEGSEL